MSREIKFRLRYSETKKVVGYCEIWGGQLHYSSGNVQWDLIPITMESIRKRKGQINWEQYTGLKDKNGKEIYEGDIVKWAGYQGLVRWVFHGEEMERGTPDKIGSWYMNNGYVVDLEYGKYPEDEEDPEWVNLDNKFEVIGNIYENPELLKYL